MPTVNRSPFQYLIIIEPLGLLYGSAGRFLSPENLVGRSGTSFPPSATVLSGLFAAYDARQEPNKAKQKEKRSAYQFAGPFWAWSENIQNFFVPTPFNCLVQDGKQQIEYRMVWCEDKWQVNINDKWDKPPNEKFRKGTWLNIADWHILQSNNSNTKPETHNAPWQPVTHLHPKLRQDERRVDEESTGSLFLENAMQLDPDACLVYLSNSSIAEGWYRFGGEGHMVNLRCEPIKEPFKPWLEQPLGQSFALINPAVWGSNRLSYRSPDIDKNSLEPLWPNNNITAMLVERPHPYRYRLGGDSNLKRLSRGRYAVPAGSVYVLKQNVNPPIWQEWEDDWFPQEGYSFKRWGCGLALPLVGAILKK